MKNILFKLYWHYLDYSSFIILFFKKTLSDSKNQLAPIKSKSFEAEMNINPEAIVFVPELNWELELINEIDKKFKTHIYRGIESKEFFNHRSEWFDWRAETSRAIFDYVNDLTNKNQNKNFVFFSYLSDFNLDPKIAKKISSIPNIMMVNFNWDDVQHFSRNIFLQPIGVKKVSRYFDINYTVSRKALSHYDFNKSKSKIWKGSRLDVEEEYFPLQNKRINKVLFVGAKFGIREKLIKSIKDSGIEVDCFGRGWGTRMLSNDEYREYVPKYSIVIGNSLIGHSNHHMIVKGRDFEIPNFGGLYLTSFFNELNDFYNIGEEILTYKNINQAISIINKVLQNPDSFEEIRYKGWLRTRMYNTWESRIKSLHIEANHFFNPNKTN